MSTIPQGQFPFTEDVTEPQIELFRVTNDLGHHDQVPAIFKPEGFEVAEPSLIDEAYIGCVLVYRGCRANHLGDGLWNVEKASGESREMQLSDLLWPSRTAFKLWVDSMAVVLPSTVSPGHTNGIVMHCNISSL